MNKHTPVYHDGTSANHEDSHFLDVLNGGKAGIPKMIKHRSFDSSTFALLWSRGLG